ncbi:hypothetical protein [Brucella anthropi]|uniref:hypothetical protein n=1 Tax=Brucella anthropi TaxID=529 RepID=UPI00124DED7F|nr:hypothetical protein [Brucella anthropi]KAB2783176.1 hypothetical protein F9K99_01120 [Brucella anthropi]
MGINENRTSKRAIAVASLLLLSGRAFAENEAYPSLDGLTLSEKKSVVLCVRGTISNNYRDTVAHNLAEGGSDATWAMKVNALENVQMSDLARAADWIDMETYYRQETDNIQELIRGKTGIEEYKSVSKQNSLELGKILEPEIKNQSEHTKNFQKFSIVCKSIASKIIGKAKAASSQ